MARRWIWIMAILAVCILVSTGLVSCDKGKPLSQMGPAKYVGSDKCAECHSRIAITFRNTLHQKVIQDTRKNPRAIQGNFVHPDPLVDFKPDDVVMTHGVQWKQRYVDKDWRTRVAQWNFETEKWSPYNAAGWKEADWRKKCGYCHVVGFDYDKLTWSELSVGCEACHGPASNHIDSKLEDKIKTIVNPATLPFRAASDICGQCHTRGKSPDKKWDSPVGFRVGDYLGPQHFTVAEKSDMSAWWPSGHVKQHRQQYPEWKGSQHAKAGIGCSTCHSVHEARTKFATTMNPNNLCQSCHGNVSTDSIRGHAPIAGAPQHSDCIGCHMPPTGASSTRGDERSHQFRTIPPKVTVELGAGDPAKQPNSCNHCHSHKNQKPEQLQKALDDGKKLLEKITITSVTQQ
ncbi:multiheme c-type cytochrome [Desulfomonile tiedjei]|uniref:Formate-dependent nitrite reductase, periplasmic cytochrome c552 subunit n=1 Tax=Desulfomonile tiedjei (strain ATCC 49306 / DSM 6799 / DCB-1) TaxID=706587 RepID=I4CCC6_DESTA|nr:multiheme c-type cytochrome [Desulfomonile tiedjei]AFM27217.1 formate-dependent nitrite reductase, periplasmic cytochrome c552 subunit [Desulfomonile tiedjei DSM 6799]